MKFKLLFISRVLITTFLIGISTYAYFIGGFNRRTVSPKVKVQNYKYEIIDYQVNINGGSNIKSIFSLTNEDFVIEDKNNYIELGRIYGDLKTNEKITKTVPADENSIYDVYEFENFTILTQPGGGSSSIIGSINILTPIIQTSRGISVGDTISEVIEKYGNPDVSSIADSISPGQYMYQYNGGCMTYFVDKNEKVVLIRFEIV